MCSIIGYRGKNSAAPILVNGLQRMEYRGYDSVGVATKSKNQILLRKGVGKVIEVNNDLKDMHRKGELLDFDDRLMGTLESILGI